MSSGVLCVGIRFAHLGSNFASSLEIPSLAYPWVAHRNVSSEPFTWDYPLYDGLRAGDREFIAASCPNSHTLSTPAGFTLEQSVRRATDGLGSSCYIWSRAAVDGPVTINASSSTSIAAVRFVMRARSGFLTYSWQAWDASGGTTSAVLPNYSVGADEILVPVHFARWHGASTPNFSIMSYSNSSFFPRPDFAAFGNLNSDWVAVMVGMQQGLFGGALQQRNVVRGLAQALPGAWWEKIAIRFRDNGSFQYNRAAYRAAVQASDPFYYWPLEPQNFLTRQLVPNSTGRFVYQWVKTPNADMALSKPNQHGSHDVYGVAVARPDLESQTGETGWLIEGASFGQNAQLYGLDFAGYQEFYEAFYPAQEMTIECAVRGKTFGDLRLSTNNSGAGSWQNLSPFGDQAINVGSTFPEVPRPSVAFVHFGVLRDSFIALGMAAAFESPSLEGSNEPPTLIAMQWRADRGYVVDRDFAIAASEQFVIGATDWTHVAARYSQTAIELLVNGEVVSTVPGISNHWGDLFEFGDLRHGWFGEGLSLNHFGMGALYSGWIGEVALWPRLVPDEEIASHAALLNVRI